MVLITGMFLLFVCLEVENNEDSQNLYLLFNWPDYHGKSLISADNRNVLDPGADLKIQGLQMKYGCRLCLFWSPL